MSARRLDIDEVTARLGVKRETVYAYVSRGYLRSEPAADGRTSTFDPVEVEALAQRSRPRRRPRRGEGIDVTLSSAITQLHDGAISYRERPLGELAGRRFEDVAELLWSGVLPEAAAPPRWTTDGAVVEAVRGVLAQLPSSCGAGTRLRAAVATTAAFAPPHHDLGPEAVMATGRTLIATMVNALAPTTPPAPSTSRTAPATTHPPRIERPVAEAVSEAVAGRLAARWRPVLDLALVLLADHELATSTLAARVAASTRADPAAAVLAGLAAVSGPLHGSASVAAQRFISAAAAEPGAAVADELRRHGSLPGFGHPVHRRGDPRAPLLLGALRDAAAGRSRDRARMADAERVIEVASARTGTPNSGAAPNSDAAPNIDVALGAFGYVAGLPLGSTELIFSIARMAGWIAHAMEEYGEAPLRFRTRTR